MPDMILHYITDHHWLPPAKFIEDVMRHSVVERNASETQKVGYLSGPFDIGMVPDGFVAILRTKMFMAPSRSRTKTMNM